MCLRLPKSHTKMQMSVPLKENVILFAIEQEEMDRNNTEGDEEIGQDS